MEHLVVYDVQAPLAQYLMEVPYLRTISMVVKCIISSTDLLLDLIWPMSPLWMVKSRIPLPTEDVCLVTVHCLFVVV